MQAQQLLGLSYEESGVWGLYDSIFTLKTRLSQTILSPSFQPILSNEMTGHDPILMLVLLSLQIMSLETIIKGSDLCEPRLVRPVFTIKT